ncbi:hypothetical protein [Mycoplasmopsis felis]|uniref:hypothetical protein n=1 Tax=Mycoplasmopsis felis TaxID=33923 RepID=UPI003B838856
MYFWCLKYNDNVLFCDFKITDYINNKLNSSFAHIYINGFYQGLKYNIFNKVDLRNNHICIIKSNYLYKYINENNHNFQNLFSVFSNFNKTFNFNETLMAINCIKEMKENDWYQAKGVERPDRF